MLQNFVPPTKLSLFHDYKDIFKILNLNNEFVKLNEILRVPSA